MPKLFIASSTPSKPIVTSLAVMLADHFEVVPWYDGFSAGQLTLQILVAARSQYDCAICVFGKDDAKQIPTDPSVPQNSESEVPIEPIARDNVVLEFGLFLGALGPTRVLILADDKVRIPSDLAGLTLLQYDGSNPAKQKAQLQQHADRIAKQWTPLPPIEAAKAPPPDDRGLGFTQTILDIEGRLKGVRHHLEVTGVECQPVTDEPVRFDLTDECVSTYAEAVVRTQSRFWVTTYLNSGFWSNPEAKVLDANSQLASRTALRSNLRRVFMMESPLEQHLARLREELSLLRRMRRFSEMADKKKELVRLSENIKAQQESGFEVRVGHDTDDAHSLVPRSVRFDPFDTEVAIFDRFRVDFYSAVRNGRIQSVHCYTRMVRDFGGILQATELYFEELWKKSIAVDEVLAQMDRVHAEAERQIDYEPHWLAEFELDLSPDDVELKTLELGRVKEIVRTRFPSDRVSSLLDIGTCTARYPIALDDLVEADGEIIGIDNDPDCVKFARGLVRKKCLHKRIDIRHVDFLLPGTRFERKFGLITCMLGTLSHFGWRRNEKFEDDLQASLVRMRELLEPRGLLIIGNWSDTAVANNGMLLAIYGDRERRRLAQDTALKSELRVRLEKAGLRIAEEVSPDPRIDMYVCDVAG